VRTKKKMEARPASTAHRYLQRYRPT